MNRLLVAAAALTLAAPPLLAHQNEREEVSASVAGKTVKVEYGRPGLKGRDMLGRAEVGMKWRMGADAATTFDTDADLSFGDVEVPKGSYRLEALKASADAWHLLVVDGDRETVAEIPLETKTLEEPAELFTIQLKGDGEKGKFVMSWGTTALVAGFTGK